MMVMMTRKMMRKRKRMETDRDDVLTIVRVLEKRGEKGLRNNEESHIMPSLCFSSFNLALVNFFLSFRVSSSTRDIFLMDRVVTGRTV